eukprot:scaffold1307_cov200-Pinguiococcus_pyrenoidosus.AAC.8
MASYFNSSENHWPRLLKARILEQNTQLGQARVLHRAAIGPLARWVRLRCKVPTTDFSYRP